MENLNYPKSDKENENLKKVHFKLFYVKIKIKSSKSQMSIYHT